METTKLVKYLLARMTVAELAVALSVDTRSIIRWRDGETEPYLVFKKKLRELYSASEKKEAVG